MADFLGVKARHAGQEVARVFHAGQEVNFAFGRGTLLFSKAAIEIYGRTECRTVVETDAYWFEFGFRIDTVLSGNSGAGFSDAGNYFRIECEQSTNLVNWSMGKFIPSPAGAVINNGDGTHTYWHRSTVPIWWFNILVDLTITSNRYGKSITGLSIGQVPVSLPAFPYAMPSQAANLQTHLRAAGYAGAVISSVTAPLSVEIKNHTVGGVSVLPATMSGASVTGVTTNGGASIPLPGYPYAMPAQQAALQAALQAAGQSGAVVRLYGDEWTILLPDRPAAAPLQRLSAVTITPDDPYPAWDKFETYLGYQSAAAASGTSGNVRLGLGGDVAAEAVKQFARLKISAGTRYDPYR